jgi:hypothetical protein
VYCNSMRVTSAPGGPTEFVCSDIDDFLKFERHRSLVCQETQERDLKVEKRNYGNVIVLERD